jgi:hypothetical protein
MSYHRNLLVKFKTETELSWGQVGVVLDIPQKYIMEYRDNESCFFTRAHMQSLEAAWTFIGRYDLNFREPGWIMQINPAIDRAPFQELLALSYPSHSNIWGDGSHLVNAFQNYYDELSVPSVADIAAGRESFIFSNVTGTSLWGSFKAWVNRITGRTRRDYFKRYFNGAVSEDTGGDTGEDIRAAFRAATLQREAVNGPQPPVDEEAWLAVRRAVSAGTAAGVIEDLIASRLEEDTDTDTDTDTDGTMPCGCAS